VREKTYIWCLRITMIGESLEKKGSNISTYLTVLTYTISIDLSITSLNPLNMISSPPSLADAKIIAKEDKDSLKRAEDDLAVEEANLMELQTKHAEKLATIRELEGKQDSLRTHITDELEPAIEELRRSKGV
jgi:hypothetical protein